MHVHRYSSRLHQINNGIILEIIFRLIHGVMGWWPDIAQTIAYVILRTKKTKTIFLNLLNWKKKTFWETSLVRQHKNSNCLNPGYIILTDWNIAHVLWGNAWLTGEKWLDFQAMHSNEYPSFNKMCKWLCLFKRANSRVNIGTSFWNSVVIG